jgi:hypothetical protein
MGRSHVLDTESRIGNVLVDMYSKCGEIAYAREVFDCLHEPSVVSWTAGFTNSTETGSNCKFKPTESTEFW